LMHGLRYFPRPTYYRFVPGGLDILRYGLRGKGAQLLERISLRPSNKTHSL
jgi:hypothetical protein